MYKLHGSLIIISPFGVPRYQLIHVILECVLKLKALSWIFLRYDGFYTFYWVWINHLKALRSYLKLRKLQNIGLHSHSIVGDKANGSESNPPPEL